MGQFNIKVRQYRHLQAKYRKIIPPEIKQGSVEQGFSKARYLGVDAGLSTYTGDFGPSQLSHLIKRTHFGCSPDQLDTHASKSLNEVINQILVSDQAPDLPVNDYNNFENFGADPDVPFGQTWINAPFNQMFEGPRLISLKSWWLRQMISPVQGIHQKMMLFWHNFLPVQFWDIFVAKAAYHYLDKLRAHALGNFKGFIRALTLDPAMLIYLNGAFNNREAPDENYSRELQELFCIGKGPGSAYTEQDVQSAAKVLTGWTIRWETLESEGVPTSYFQPLLHDTSDKVFSDFYGNRVIEGRSGQSGAEELDDLLAMIFDNPETANHLARRLYTFFVYNEISDVAEQNVIAPLAQVIRDHDYELLPALRTLLMSEHFFHPEIAGAQIKSPADFILGHLNPLDLPLDEKNSTSAFEMQAGILWQMSLLGMEVGDPPSVAGWPAYYQAPQFDKSWITTDSITNRARQTDALVYWGFPVAADRLVSIDLLAFLEQLTRPDDINLMLEEVGLIFLGISLSPAQLDQVKATLLSGQQNDGYWNTAWLQYVSDKDNVEYQNVLLNRIRPAFQQLFQLAEAQLM